MPTSSFLGNMGDSIWMNKILFFLHRESYALLQFLKNGHLKSQQHT